MKNIEKYIFIFLFGGLGYGLLEIIFRGFTHWSMIITGGSALIVLYLINLAIPDTPIILKALLGAFCITIIEFSVGIIVNKVFSFGVWDYTGSFGNVLGVITPIFSLCWFGISLIVNIVFRNMQKIIRTQKFGKP